MKKALNYINIQIARWFYRLPPKFQNALIKIFTPPKKKWSRKAYGTVKILFISIACFFLLDIIFPVHTDIEYAPVVKSKDSVVLYAFLTKDQQWRMFTTLDEITPELSKAIVFKEDRYFHRHPGINPVAVCRALFNNIIHWRRTSGASTITMQVARLLEPKNRSYSNKLVEMFRALQLELHYSKKQILQMYLNMVPYGSNIQGVKAASLLYFNKSPDQLSLAEITALSIIPNRPNSLVMGKDNARITEARNKWLHRFENANLFSINTIQDALKEPLNASRNTAPKNAPQFAVRMRKNYPGELNIVTTIDSRMQYKAEELTANYSRSLKLNNINNAAVIVVDNKTHGVLAYVGSSDFFDKINYGQVDGIKALRSPGSALKPFLYGVAFDKGIVTPKTVISDIPVDFKGYAPENYDLDFRGNVTIEEALRQSLNIPAVKTLNNVGVANFVNDMHSAGFTSIWNARKKMGLSMILGGCGVRLEEMAALYSALANEGKYYPLQWTISKSKKKNTIDTAIQILSPEADYMVTQILRELQRPDLPNANVSAVNVPKIAWKTGTSYGRRDGWSIGYNKRYTIAVWTGNFSGQGAAELSGAATATPLLFQLFNAIDRNPVEEPVDAPAGLKSRLVCSVSGLPPNDFCTDQIMDAYIPGVSSNAVCQHLKQVYLSADEKFSYCTSCLPATGYKVKWYPNIDPELAAFYEQRHIQYEAIPEHNPNCSRYFEGTAPKINSLTDGATYLITDKGKQQLQLSCAASNDVTIVYWFINDKFLGSCAKGDKILFIPSNSKIKISCTDDKGRNSNIIVLVKFI